MERHKSDLSLIESQNADDAGSKRLGISHLDQIELYRAIIGKLTILVRATSNFIKSPSKPALFHATTF